jgi:hypothetical protein
MVATPSLTCAIAITVEKANTKFGGNADVVCRVLRVLIC